MSELRRRRGIGRASMGARAMLALAAVLAAMLAGGVPAANAQQDAQRIAAVVNDEIISMFDLDARVQFALLTSGAPDTPETRKRFQQQVLKGMIDEKLERQEATKQNIKVTETEINRALRDIEKQNNMPAGGLDTYLNRNNVPRSAMTQQVEASLSWQKLVQRKVKPHVDIGDDEVEEMLKRIEANRGQAEMHVAEIFLAVDSPEQEDEVLRTMEKLIEQLQRGARFQALARQFSQSASAAAGGDLGWVQHGQLDEQLEQTLSQMPSSTISKPVRTVGGYHLLALIERREAGGVGPVRVKLLQALMPIPPHASPPEIDSIKQQLAAAAIGSNDCKAFAEALKQAPRARANPVNDLAVNELPTSLQKAIEPLKVGGVTDPIQADAGTLMTLMLCDRKQPEPTPLPTREDVRERISQQRVDLMAQRYLRDLRRAAFIDLRV